MSSSEALGGDRPPAESYTMNANTQICPDCGEGVPCGRFCAACGEDQRLHSRILGHTPIGRFGAFGRTAIIAIALWIVVTLGLCTASGVIAASDPEYSHDPGYAIFWTLFGIVFWTLVAGTPIGLVMMIVNWRIGAGILAAVGAATALAVLTVAVLVY